METKEYKEIKKLLETLRKKVIDYDYKTENIEFDTGTILARIEKIQEDI